MAEVVALEGKLDLAAVGPLHAALSKHAGKDVVLDLEKVTHIGALCVQTCIAAARQAKSSGTMFDIQNASDHLLVQLNWMGLTPEDIEEGVQ
ncbi:MAG: STAS domain-containing protein [Pseudomonadota bacterium]